MRDTLIENAGSDLRLPDTTREDSLLESGYSCIVGLDEAGRGAWAGPVFAGGVMLPKSPEAVRLLSGCVRDSKQLTPRAREQAFETILRVAAYVGVGVATREEIDELGIAPATRLAWMRAIEDLPQADFLLLDAFRLPESSLPQMAIIKGDNLCLSIAAASIVAKVARDRYMCEASEDQPLYGFDHNKGYGTRYHFRALTENGPCHMHRRSFAPVNNLADNTISR